MPQLHSTSNLRPVNVHYYMKVFFFNDDPLHAQVNHQHTASSLLFAKVSWLYPHPHRLKIGKPAEVWYRSQNEILVCICLFQLSILEDVVLIVLKDMKTKMFELLFHLYMNSFQYLIHDQTRQYNSCNLCLFMIMLPCMFFMPDHTLYMSRSHDLSSTFCL